MAFHTIFDRFWSLNKACVLQFRPDEQSGGGRTPGLDHGLLRADGRSVCQRGDLQCGLLLQPLSRFASICHRFAAKTADFQRKRKSFLSCEVLPRAAETARMLGLDVPGAES